MGNSRWPFVTAGLGLALLVWGSVWGLFYAPREVYMGDVQRIMYVHVPTAWNAMLALTFAFACALLSLFRGQAKEVLREQPQDGRVVGGGVQRLAERADGDRVVSGREAGFAEIDEHPRLGLDAKRHLEIGDGIVPVADGTPCVPSERKQREPGARVVGMGQPLSRGADRHRPVAGGLVSQGPALVELGAVAVETDRDAELSIRLEDAPHLQHAVPEQEVAVRVARRAVDDALHLCGRFEIAPRLERGERFVGARARGTPRRAHERGRGERRKARASHGCACGCLKWMVTTTLRTGCPGAGA